MKLKYTVKNATCAESPGGFNDDAAIKLDISHISKELAKKIETAINGALSD